MPVLVVAVVFVVVAVVLPILRPEPGVQRPRAIWTLRTGVLASRVRQLGLDRARLAARGQIAECALVAARRWSVVTWMHARARDVLRGGGAADGGVALAEGVSQRERSRRGGCESEDGGDDGRGAHDVEARIGDRGGVCCNECLRVEEECCGRAEGQRVVVTEDGAGY